MENLFICYPKCGTCKKAKEFLEQKKIPYQMRDITVSTPTKEELMLWCEKSNLPLKSFFNTSGLMYKQLHLKDKLFLMSELEKLEILSNNGMLIKRPIFVSDELVLVGFNEEAWSKIKGSVIK